MTALELLTYQLEATGGQLSKVLKGIDPTWKDFRLHDGGMSISEQVAHLAEAYQAVLTSASGGNYEWGTFKPKSEEWLELVEEALALRQEAIKVVLVDEDKKLKLGTDFMVFHDLYHVGQLATMRLNLHPTWNSYEIYG